MFPYIANNGILNNTNTIANNPSKDESKIEHNQIIDLDKSSYQIISSGSNNQTLSLQEKQDIIQNLNGLIQEYKNSIKPSGRWVLDVKSFVGYQIVDNRAVNNNTALSLPSQFDQLLDQSINQANIQTRSNVYSIIYGLQLLTRTFTNFKQHVIIKLIVTFGFSLSYRLKENFVRIIMHVT